MLHHWQPQNYLQFAKASRMLSSRSQWNLTTTPLPATTPQFPNQPGATLKLKKTLAVVVVVDFLSSTSSSSFNIHILSLWMPGRGRMQYKRRQMNESGRQIASENQTVRAVRTVVIQPYRTSELNESCSLNSKWQAVSYVSQPMWSDHQKGYQGRENLAKGSTGDYQKQLCVCLKKNQAKLQVPACKRSNVESKNRCLKTW